MEKVYLPGDHPKDVDPAVATSVKSLLKQIPVRGTHEEVNVHMGNKKPKTQPSPRDAEPLAAMNHFMSMMTSLFHKAKAMDECQVDILQPARTLQARTVPESSVVAQSRQLALPNGPPEHTESSETLAKGIEEDGANGLQLATIPGASCTDGKDQEMPPADASLESFEEEAFARLQARKQNGKVLKKPACSKPAKASTVKTKVEPKATMAKSKPGPKAKASSSKPKASPKKQSKQNSKPVRKTCGKSQQEPAGNCWGCIRCRGNTLGCSTCRQQGFRGLRVHGRDAWKRWHMSKTAKKA